MSPRLAGVLDRQRNLSRQDLLAASLVVAALVAGLLALM